MDYTILQVLMLLIRLTTATAIVDLASSHDSSLTITDNYQSQTYYPTNGQEEREPKYVSEPPLDRPGIISMLLANAKYFTMEEMSRYFTFVEEDDAPTRSMSQTTTTFKLPQSTLENQSSGEMQIAAATTIATTTPPPPPPSTTTTIMTPEVQTATQEVQTTIGTTTEYFVHFTGPPPVRILNKNEPIVAHMRKLISEQIEREEAALNNYSDIATTTITSFTNMEYDTDYDTTATTTTVEPQSLTTESRLITSEPQQLLTKETISNNGTTTETSTSSIPIETTIITTIGTNAAAAAAASTSSSTIGTAFRGTLLVALLLLLL